MPRSFLVKKIRQKSTANATNESKWQGRSHDLRDQSFPVVSHRPKTTPVQESSKTNLENGIETLRVYPAEVTSSNFQSLETNSSTPPLDLESEVGGIEEEAENAEENFSANSTIDKKRVRHRCVECHRCFATISGLHKHKQFHCSSSQSRKAFACKYCDKTYVSLGALKMHIRTHTLPCQCKICGKAFSRPWLLQGHIRTHTGEKPYQCPNCQRAFADRSNLRAHLQTHSSVKKYSCNICSRSFSRMSLLLKHQYSCNDGNELS